MLARHEPGEELLVTETRRDDARLVDDRRDGFAQGIPSGGLGLEIEKTLLVRGEAVVIRIPLREVLVLLGTEVALFRPGRFDDLAHPRGHRLLRLREAFDVAVHVVLQAEEPAERARLDGVPTPRW